MQTKIVIPVKYSQAQHIIDYPTQQSPIDIISINSKLCVLAYRSFCLTVPLPFKPNQYKRINFQDTINLILPCSQGFCLMLVNNKIYFVNSTTNECSSIPINVSDKNFSLRLFSRSRQLYQYQTDNNYHSLINILNKDLKAENFSRNHKHVSNNLQSADEIQTIIKQINHENVSLYNMRTEKQIQIKLPFKDKVQCFYLQSEHSGICVRKFKQIYSLWMVELQKQNPYFYELHNIPDQRHKLFLNSLSSNLKLLLLSNIYQAYVYNYKKEVVVSRFDHNVSQIAKQMSWDFLSFVRWRVEKNGSVVLKEYSAVSSIRKLMMHLYIKAGIWNLYKGDALLLRVFRLVDLD